MPDEEGSQSQPSAATAATAPKSASSPRPKRKVKAGPDSDSPTTPPSITLVNHTNQQVIVDVVLDGRQRMIPLQGRQSRTLTGEFYSPHAEQLKRSKVIIIKRNANTNPAR